MGKYHSQNIYILTVTIKYEIKFVLFQTSNCKSSLLRYCNSRVSVYDEAGRHMHDINGDWTVVHSLALYEQVRSDALSYNINGCCMNEEVVIIFFFLLQNSHKELSNKTRPSKQCKSLIDVLILTGWFLVVLGQYGVVLVDI